jgi:hypothetical protein
MFQYHHINGTMFGLNFDTKSIGFKKKKNVGINRNILFTFL